MIRPAEQRDVQAIEAIVERAYGGYVELIGGRPAPMDDDYAARVGEGVVQVAEEDGAVVGLIVLEPHAGHMQVDNVAVDPDRQGEGTGRALLAHAEDLARESGLGEMRLFTHVKMTANQALYRGIGYVEVERVKQDWFERVFYAKRLPPPG